VKVSNCLERNSCPFLLQIPTERMTIYVIWFKLLLIINLGNYKLIKFIFIISSFKSKVCLEFYISIINTAIHNGLCLSFSSQIKFIEFNSWTRRVSKK